MGEVIGFNGTGPSCEAVSDFTAGPKGTHDGSFCQWKSNTNMGGWVYCSEMGWMEFRPGDSIAKTDTGFIAFTPRNPQTLQQRLSQSFNVHLTILLGWEEDELDAYECELATGLHFETIAERETKAVALAAWLSIRDEKRRQGIQENP